MFISPLGWQAGSLAAGARGRVDAAVAPGPVPGALADPLRGADAVARAGIQAGALLGDVEVIPDLVDAHGVVDGSPPDPLQTAGALQICKFLGVRLISGNRGGRNSSLRVVNSSPPIFLLTAKLYETLQLPAWLGVPGLLLQIAVQVCRRVNAGNRRLQHSWNSLQECEGLCGMQP